MKTMQARFAQAFAADTVAEVVHMTKTVSRLMFLGASESPEPGPERLVRSLPLLITNGLCHRRTLLWGVPDGGENAIQ
jgi:hypothetical protein